jgi:hypothetical protein
MTARVQRRTVTGACLLFVMAGVAAVAARFTTDGGGSYGDIFFPLGIVSLALLGWSFAALRQFRRGGTVAFHPLIASVLTLIALLLFAVAIGLRG